MNRIRAGLLMSVVALASLGCVAEAGDVGEENEVVSEAKQALGSEFWIYGQPFTGTIGTLPAGCELVEGAQIIDEYGEGTPTTIIGVTASKEPVPNDWAWDRQVRYGLMQQEIANSAAWASDLDACASSAGVTLTAWASWFVGNYGQP
jgi:hypothetical protein